MTSRSPPSACWLLLLTCCAGPPGQGPGLPPDAPAPALARKALRVVPAAPARYQQAGLRSVRVRRAEPALALLGGKHFARGAQEALVIDVRLDRPLDPAPRDSAPQVLLNGQPLPLTFVRVQAPDQVLALLPGRQLIQQENTVAVRWPGGQPQSPLRFRSAEIEE